MRKNIIWSEQRRAAACSIGRPAMLRRLAAMLVMIVCAAATTWATDVTFTLGDKLTDTKDGVTFAFDGVCIIVKSSTNLSHVKMPKKDASLTISVGSGKTIDNIKLQVLKGATTSVLADVPSVSFDSSASKITYNTDGGLNATWTGKTQVVLQSDGNKVARFYSITVSYTDNGTAEIPNITIGDIDKPSISPSTGTYAVMPKVTFTDPNTDDMDNGLTQEGYYTLDGTDPTVSETAVKYDGNAFTPVLPDGTNNITVRYAIKRFQTNKPANAKWSDYAEATYTIKAEAKEVTNEVIALNTKDATTTGDDSKGYTLTKVSDNITIKYVGKTKPGSGSVNFITGDKLTITSSENIRKIELNYSKNYAADKFDVSPESSGTSKYTKNLLTWTANDNASVKEVTFTDNHGTGNKVQLSSVTVYYDGYNLPVAPALDPTPGKGDVYLAIPEITLTPANNSTLTGTFTTVYTVDGSDPTENTAATTATGVTKWTPSITLAKETQTYTVKAATKRVVNGETLWSDIITREFTYGIADPTIDPTEEKFVNTNASQTITIDHPQKDKGVNVYVAKYTGNEKQDASYTNVDLPYSFELKKQTTTVKMYAEYNGVKTEVETNVYIYLDASEAYIITSEEGGNITSGTEIEKKGVTMTFGGMYLGKDKDGKEIGGFKTLSKGKVPELGYTRFVRSETIVLGVNDAASETKVEYVHPQQDAKQHDNTFALPAQGSFFKFEPEYNGTLTVFVEQQGAIDKSGDGGFTPQYVKKRPVYFIDEAGQSIPADYAYTTSRINKSDWKKTMSTASEAYKTWYTKEYIQTLKDYYNDIIHGNNKDYKNINAAIDANKQHDAVTLGTDFQPVIALHTSDSQARGILKNDGIYGADGDQNIDQTGYMLINEGYVTYRFPVKAGKTYFLFGWRTKLGICGFRFQKDEAATAAVTLDGSADNTAAIQGLEVGKQYNVTLKNRTFKQDKWYALVLPFSVSQQQMKQVFGDDVMTVHFDGVDGTDLDLFEHFYKMAVGGTPLLVKPSQDVAGDIQFKNVTVTSKEVQPIVKNGFKADGSWDNVDFPEYSYFIDAKTNTFYQYNPNKVTGTAKPHAGAMRAWVIAEGNAAQAKQLTMHINGIGDSQETDGIRSALFGEADAEQTASLTGIYTISGQKLAATSTKGLAKGMYIVNGKKLIVK